MKDQVLKIISQISKKTVSELEQHMDSKGLWDSFIHVELIIMLETEFNLFFSQDEIAEMNTPSKVIQYVEMKAGK